ncbi:MAG TPA: hypothetical protein VIB39_00520 [Candidatus Angelobacter sp.]|jgi:hypothetical protein
MKNNLARALLGLVVCCFTLAALGQSSRQSNDEQTMDEQRQTNQAPEAPSAIKGFNAYEVFRGMVNSSGALLKLDSSVGYDFNSHVGVFTGVPIYFAHDASNTPGQTDFDSVGAGDVYFGLETYVPSQIVNLTSTVIVSAPTGSVSKGFSPGQATVDWNNRFRRRFGRLAPFVSAGIGNTVPDSDLIIRNFISVGNVAHFEEGTDLDLTRHVYVGGSAYQIVPFGEQKVFNRFETASPRDGSGGSGKGGPGNSGPGGGGDHDGGPAPGAPPPGDAGQPSATGNDLTQEHGFSAWLGFEPTRVLRLELGYSRSVTFNLNSFSFNVGFNVGRLFRSGQSH